MKNLKEIGELLISKGANINAIGILSINQKNSILNYWNLKERKEL